MKGKNYLISLVKRKKKMIKIACQEIKMRAWFNQPTAASLVWSLQQSGCVPIRCWGNHNDGFRNERH